MQTAHPKLDHHPMATPPTPINAKHVVIAPPLRGVFWRQMPTIFCLIHSNTFIYKFPCAWSISTISTMNPKGHNETSSILVETRLRNGEMIQIWFVLSQCKISSNKVLGSQTSNKPNRSICASVALYGDLPNTQNVAHLREIGRLILLSPWPWQTPCNDLDLKGSANLWMIRQWVKKR